MTDKKIESTAMPTADEDQHTLSDFEKKPKKLRLDTNSYKPAKTRAELYKELMDAEVILDEDVYEYANPLSRGLALVIDLGFLFCIIYTALLLAPFELQIVQHFLGIYKIELIFTPETTMEIFNILNVLATLFFAIVIPVAFFNCSLGKKILKLRVRGDNTYTISLSKAFQRELIFKPVSMIILVGFILPFFDKDKKSIHDKLAGTLVIKD